jgi:hypothetical protein
LAIRRIHTTTGVPPAARLAEERMVLLAPPVKQADVAPAPALRRGRVLSHESLQHPLSVYAALLEGAA